MITYGNFIVTTRLAAKKFNFNTDIKSGIIHAESPNMTDAYLFLRRRFPPEQVFMHCDKTHRKVTMQWKNGAQNEN